MPGCATPPIPRSSIPRSVAISRPRTPISTPRWRRTSELIEQLHAELKARIKADDSSVPVREGGVRVPLALLRARSTGPGSGGRWRPPSPTLLLDEARLAAGKGYFSLRALDVSPDGRLLAYTTDEDGSERYRLHLRDLATGAELADLVANTSGAVEWAEDGAHAALRRAQRPAAAVPGARPPAGRRPGRRRRALRGGRPGLLRLDRQDAQPPLPPDRDRHPRHARDPAARCAPTRQRRRGWWRRGARATATASTTRMAGSGS